MATTSKPVLQRLKPSLFFWVDVAAKGTTYKDSRARSEKFAISAAFLQKNRSLSASRARQTAAGKKKHRTPFGMTLETLLGGRVTRCFLRQ
jgi:hypothetical protein